LKKRRDATDSFSINEYRFKECCRNPWDEDCDNWDIAVYIRYKGYQRPICKSCWREISNNGIEWG
jgi:hypothetical protein